ncbi:MAG: hypothetical protein ACE361_14725 [Aureliella sp.]
MFSIIRPTAIAGSLITILLSNAPLHADLIVSMTGTIAEGQLDGTSIDGQSFEIDAVLASGMDTNGIPTVGFFELSSAQLTLANGDVFDFDPATTVYAQAYQRVGDDFAIGFRVPTTDGSPPATLGYVDQDQPNLPFDFDPSAFQAFTYASFDVPFASAGGPHIFESGSRTLRVDTLGMVGASVTAVPEPNTATLIGMLAVMTAAFRRRIHNC